MRFFFPDSQDQIDPSFDFETETRSETRVRQRDDQYAHECFSSAPYDGLLVSMSMVDLEARETTRYTLSQRHRLHRSGIRKFFRIDAPQFAHIQTMGDCGAFNYVREEVPPYSAQDVAGFYDRCQFDYGVSVDHIILGFESRGAPTLRGLDTTPTEWATRRELTLDLADQFLRLHQTEKLSFVPIGVAQGWSAETYADSVEQLQKMGYVYIGLGGLVPLKSHEILECLEAIEEVRRAQTKLHLFGISRVEHAQTFARYGVASIDSTSPFRQAFKSAHDNFYTPQRNYVAVRIPQVDGNTKLRKRVQAGEIDQTEARRLEAQAMALLIAYDTGDVPLEPVLDAISRYDELLGTKSRVEAYRETLDAAPWKNCKCDICSTVGIHSVIFRGSERNKRRGFHNLHVFYEMLRREFDANVEEPERLHG